MNKNIVKQLQIACNITYSIPGLKQHIKPYRKDTPSNALKFKDGFDLFKGGYDDRDIGLIGLVDFNETDKYNILIAFRGTVGVFDWLNDFRDDLVDSPYSKGKVHRGFLDSIKNLEVPMNEKLNELLRDNGGAIIYITGHSKGGALATLMGQFIVSNNEDLKDHIKWNIDEALKRKNL